MIPHKIIIAVDSFKGCLSSLEVANMCELGIHKVFPRCQTIKVPIADGGEGILNALLNYTDGEVRTVSVHNPLMELIDADYGILNDGKTAIIEMAKASGLTLISSEKRNPMKTTTFGTGELIKDAIENGCSQLLVGIGGSATNDAGLGMLQALGFRFLDKEGNELGQGGEMMEHVFRIDDHKVMPALRQIKFRIACDVTNPFCGPNGAASVFGSQKGASPQAILSLNKGMEHLSTILSDYTGKDIRNMRGAGAAGGSGGIFAAFLNAELLPGIELILKMIHFKELLSDADLIITGEGKMDAQTWMGKAPQGILSAAQKANVPVVAIAGSVQNTQTLSTGGFDAVCSITPAPVSIEEAMCPETARQNICHTITQIMHLIAIGEENDATYLNRSAKLPS